MKYLIAALSLFVTSAHAWNTWDEPTTFVTPNHMGGTTAWTPGQLPITSRPLEGGGVIISNPNSFQDYQGQWIEAEQYRKYHVLPHVIR